MTKLILRVGIIIFSFSMSQFGLAQAQPEVAQPHQATTQTSPDVAAEHAHDADSNGIEVDHEQEHDFESEGADAEA
jgi:hypothetical protein